MKRKLIAILMVVSVFHFVAQARTFWKSLDDTWTYTHDPVSEATCRWNMAAFDVLAVPLNPWSVLTGPRVCRLIDRMVKDHGVAPIFFMIPLGVVNSLVWGLLACGVFSLGSQMKKKLSQQRLYGIANPDGLPNRGGERSAIR